MKEKKRKESKIKTNALGVSGFTLAISSIAILLIGSYGILLMPLIGLVFCINQQRAKPTKIGKVGIILNILSIILLVVYLVWIAPIITEYLQNYSATL
jgi:hypothetical protein